jgi:2-polyprenyl-6-methoxyphenol hydroxylase-like FAD-dependent oxidoreductase
VRALVVGAGIGGVAAAIALRRAGIECDLFERAPAPREVGAGIVLWGNALAALRAIGAAEGVLAVGEPMRAGELRDARGRVLSRQRVEEWDRDLGEPSVVAHRAELLEGLLASLPGEPPRFGHECVDVRAASDGVELAFANGNRARGELVIGADGLSSRVRRALGDASPPRYSGYTCWRAIASVAEELVPPGYLCETWGRGRRFGWLRIPRGRVYWFATLNAAQGELDPSPAAGLARLAELYRGWWGPIPTLIAATEPARLLRNDILDRPPRRGLGRGRITLLGDAAHPTTPNVGQGACLALEDAVVLARELAARPIEPALRAYERARHARTAEVVRFSWHLGRAGQWTSAFACWLRDRALAATPMAAIRRQHTRYVGFRA